MTMKTMKLALAAVAVLGVGAAMAQTAQPVTASPEALTAAQNDPVAKAAANLVSQTVQTAQSLPPAVVQQLTQAEKEKNPPPAAAEMVKDAGVQTVIKMQEKGVKPDFDPRKITAKQQVEETLKKSGIEVVDDKSRIVQIVQVDMPTTTDPSKDKKFFVKRDMMAKLLVLRMKGAIAASIGQVYDASERARIFGDEAEAAVSVTNNTSAVAKWPLFGVTMLTQAESWDGKTYSIAGAAVWSEVLHKAAKAVLLGEEIKGAGGSLTKEQWLSERDLSLMCGPRQLLDPDGNRVYLGIAAREIGLNPARDMANREAAKASAQSYLVFSLYGDVEQRLGQAAAVNIGESKVDANETIDLQLSQSVEKRVVAGAREIKSLEIDHELSGKKIYVSVFSLDQTSVARANIMAEELIATRVLTELANKRNLGRLQGYQDQIDAAKANTSEFNRGRAEANAAIQNRVAPKGRSVSDIAAPVAAPPAKSKTGVYTGENVINNDF